jgi:hypothetical protein
MDKEKLEPLARRLKSAYLSYHLGISLRDCMTTSWNLADGQTR